MSSHSNSTRPLAVAPPGPRRSFSEEDTRLKRRQHAVSACSACKARKSKCRMPDGATKCDNCEKNDTQCIFNVDDDMRRKLDQKRKIENLEEDRQLLTQLLETLRDSPNKHVMQLLNLIRSRASLEEIRFHIDQRLPQREIEKTPELEEVRSRVASLKDSESRLSHRALDIKRLSDIPVYQVPAKPWTSVTADDALVSHLVSLWLTWSHPFYNWIDRDLLLRDMRSGKVNSEYCSPFLVNSILAEASFHSDYPEVYATPDDPHSKGEHFYNEARQHYEKIEGRINIPTIQGCGVLFVCMVAMGKDRVGWWYLGQVSRMAEEFAARYPPPAEETRESRAANNTIWGVYNLTSTASISLMKPLAISQPDRPRLPCDHNPGDTWLPYPRQAEPVQSHISCVLNSFCDISEINVDANRLIFKNGKKSPRRDLERILDELDERLEKWKAELPACLQLEKVTVPQALGLQ